MIKPLKYGKPRLINLSAAEWEMGMGVCEPGSGVGPTIDPYDCADGSGPGPHNCHNGIRPNIGSGG